MYEGPQSLSSLRARRTMIRCSGKFVALENYSHTQQYGLGLRLTIGLNLRLGLGLRVGLRLGLGLGLELRLGLGLALVTL